LESVSQETVTTEGTEITEEFRYLVSVCSVFSVVRVKVRQHPKEECDDGCDAA